MTFASPQTRAYGPLPDQVGDLYMPDGGPAKVPVVCLVHGGFWRMPWGRDHIAPLALDLQARGFAVWSIEYRRVGQPGGGWPGTLDDVAAGIGHIAALGEEGLPIDARDVTLVGHSAGGQLVLWAAAQSAAGRAAGQSSSVTITRAVGLAPVADLRLACALRCGNGAVSDFLGGSPAEFGARYAAASPAARLPLGVRQLLVHGTHDEDVPVEISRRYVAAAAAAGDDVTYIELESASHMDLVDPSAAAHASLCGWLASAAEK
jgi:acetyl esterase/lipase